MGWLKTELLGMAVLSFVVLDFCLVSGTSLTTLRKVLHRKMAEGSCQQGTDSHGARCTNFCDVTTSCQSFTLTCPALDPNYDLEIDLEPLVSACQCVACFTEEEVVHDPALLTVTQDLTPSTSSPSVPPYPQCSLPPLINRTSVTRSVTSTHDVAHYQCNVNGDVYIRGTTDVTCGPNETWPDATILCAPTTCWYRHAHVGPVYAGTLTTTSDGVECQTWVLDYPQPMNAFYLLDSSYPSDNYSRAAATNYCRIFDDGGWEPAWCYKNLTVVPVNEDNWCYCDVVRCDSVPGVRLG